jgi:hypothetical protein
VVVVVEQVILPLFREHGEELVHKLRGMYAFVLSDAESGYFFAARDPIGMCQDVMARG